MTPACGYNKQSCISMEAASKTLALPQPHDSAAMHQAQMLDWQQQACTVWLTRRCLAVQTTIFQTSSIGSSLQPTSCERTSLKFWKLAFSLLVKPA